ncbi:hypothetical protein TWF718_002828 [Orbilia javanica]|uniref:Uncharacterized protein n=1 Tax=Orbilia javanica TaxID=47235 RepID=A0AAN8RAC8_9PEZI
MFEGLFKGSQKPRPDRPRPPLVPEDLPEAKRPDKMVTYTIQTKPTPTGTGSFGSLPKTTYMDYFSFWMLFYNDLKQNHDGRAQGWSCPAPLAWMYQVSSIPEPKEKNIYTMLRYPLIEYYGIYCMHFMNFISLRHDTEVKLSRNRLEVLIQNIDHVDRAFRIVLAFIPKDLMAAKLAKPWYKFGKSDHFKPQKVWLGNQLIRYRRNIVIIKACFKNMLDLMFPYGVQKNETEAPLSGWKDASKYEGHICRVPDWIFEDPHLTFLEPFSIKEYDQRAGKIILSYKSSQTKSRRLSGSGGRQATPSSQTLKPLNLGESNRKRDKDGEPWVVDMSKEDPWVSREHFAELGYMMMVEKGWRN